MAPLLPALLLLSAAATTAFAASADQITWGSVIYVYHGEKTPDLANTNYNLSPLGAVQMVEAGSVIRDRYVQPPLNASQITGQAVVNGISSDAIDNSQLSLLGTDDEYVAQSALAFMQGLYPPLNSYILDDETSLSNSSYVQYPLNGYQYPNIGSVGTNDFNYIWIAGNSQCDMWLTNDVEAMASSSYNAQVNETASFYDSMISVVFEAISPPFVNYYNAFDLYDYALYQYTHNSTVFNQLSPENLGTLQELAAQQQFQANGGDGIASVAGQTLAAKILQQFNSIVASSGVADKLTVLFGSYEPLISFFSLSNLTTGASRETLTNVPAHGSVMVFELFSPAGTGNASYPGPFPLTKDLWVRFLFRNGTDDTEPLLPYALFNRGNSETDMPWSDFVQGMGNFAMYEVPEWCDACQTSNLFCEGIESDPATSNSTASSGKQGKSKMSPAIGGVIGAIVTLGVVILIGAVLLLFGFRLNYHEKRGDLTGAAGGVGILKRNQSGGGFKGAEKLASDTDLRLKGGAGGAGATVIRHERVGSWELGDSPVSPISAPNSLDKEIGEARRRSEEEDGDEGIGHVNPFGDPVKPLDQV